ncbi:MAG: hypothetical protein IPJ71_15965 [Bdellovibrionales bacterium]|nr:hypothetical protein [Bdellovibrionales bacterium]
MPSSDPFSIVHLFFTTNPTPKEALRHLKAGHEIRLLLDGREECALFYQQDQVFFEKRKVPTADVEFTVGPEAIRQLANYLGGGVGQLGITVIKEILLGHVQIRVCGSVVRILTGGYLKIIASGGPELLNFLTQYGLNTLPKIARFIRSLKR